MGNGQKPDGTRGLWKTFAVFSGAALQWGTSIVVFSYLGHRLSQHWHEPWLTAAGAFLGVLVGATGLVFLAKQLLGGK